MSSTEVSGTGAWRQDFTDGTLQSEDKNDTARVRAIRSF